MAELRVGEAYWSHLIVPNTAGKLLHCTSSPLPLEVAPPTVSIQDFTLMAETEVSTFTRSNP